MPSVITNLSDIGKGVRMGVYLNEGVLTPFIGLVGPEGEAVGPFGTYSQKISRGDYVQPWTSSGPGHTIVAKAHSDAKPIGIVIDQPLGFPSIDPTSSTPVTVSSRTDMRVATVEWLHGVSINRVKVREAVRAGTVVGYSNTGSDWTTASTGSETFPTARIGGMTLESTSAGGLHAVLIMG